MTDVQCPLTKSKYGKDLIYLPLLRKTPSSLQPRFNTFPTAVNQEVMLQPKGRALLSQSVDKEKRLSKRGNPILYSVLGISLQINIKILSYCLKQYLKLPNLMKNIF